MGPKELNIGIKIKCVILTLINKLKITEQLDSLVLNFCRYLLLPSSGISLNSDYLSSQLIWINKALP